MAEFEFSGDWRMDAISWSSTALSLSGFARRVIAHAQGGEQLDEAALQRIKQACILDLKDSEARGLPIDHEAETFGQAVVLLEQLIDAAILGARKPR